MKHHNTKIIFYITILFERHLYNEKMFYETILSINNISQKEQEYANKALDFNSKLSKNIKDKISSIVKCFELKPIKCFSSNQGIAIPVYELFGIRFLGEGQLDYTGKIEKFNPAELINFLNKTDYKILFDECFEYFLKKGINGEDEETLFKMLEIAYENF